MAAASYPLSQHRCCGRREVGRGRRRGRLSSVARKSLWSCTLAPAIARPKGTPRPSVNTDRLTPNLPRSVGFFPVFFPAQGSLGGRAVQTLPLAIGCRATASYRRSKYFHSLRNTPRCAHSWKYRCNVLPDPNSCGRRLPLATGSQDIENAVCRLSAVPAAAVRPAESCGTWARMAPCEPRVPREYANSDTFVQRAYENPP